jgi:hypothetical protein
MAAALTPPFAVAALVLCAAGVAKLRSPRGAVRALSVVGVPAGAGRVQALAVVELAVGGWALVRPSAGLAGALALLYASFCGFSLLLARHHAACGCFGARDAPASGVQSALSAVLAGVAVAAAFSGVHGIWWLLGSPGAARGLVAALGVAASAYATVLVYTELPRAWAAWSGR